MTHNAATPVLTAEVPARAVTLSQTVDGRALVLTCHLCSATDGRMVQLVVPRESVDLALDTMTAHLSGEHPDHASA